MWKTKRTWLILKQTLGRAGSIGWRVHLILGTVEMCHYIYGPRMDVMHYIPPGFGGHTICLTKCGLRKHSSIIKFTCFSFTDIVWETFWNFSLLWWSGRYKWIFILYLKGVEESQETFYCAIWFVSYYYECHVIMLVCEEHLSFMVTTR